jgi:hypothetical protein
VLAHKVENEPKPDSESCRAGAYAARQELISGTAEEVDQCLRRLQIIGAAVVGRDEVAKESLQGDFTDDAP